VPVSAELLDACKMGLRHHYDDLFPVIDRAGQTLAGAIKKLDPGESPDPDGEGVAALEQTETYFKHRREQLMHLRGAGGDRVAVHPVEGVRAPALPRVGRGAGDWRGGPERPPGA